MSTRENPHTLGEYADILRRRRIYLLTIVPGATLLAAFIAYSLTPSYRSSATILLESSSIPKEFVQTTISSYADEQIELVQRRVMTAERLEQIVQESDPYPDRPDLTPREKASQIEADTDFQRVDPITLEPKLKSNAFSIHYQNRNPEQAARVARRLAELFLDHNRKSRSEAAESAYAFLLAQARDTEKRMGEVDRRMAEFKQKYGAALPEAVGRNEASVERAERDLQNVESQIRLAEEKVALLEIQLSKLSPTLAGTSGNWRTELATLQGQLAEARIKYTPDHPDVKRLQRQIEALSTQIGTETGAGATAPDNPEYQAVQSQLNSTRRDVAALRANAAQARGQIYEYERRLSTSPVIEREYGELTRQREVLQTQYQDLQNKLHDADISRNLETAQQGDRFTQIRAPNVPTRPFSPNRLGILLLGIVLGAGLAAGLAALAESADPSVRSKRDLSAITQLPVLAGVPVVFNASDRRKQLTWRGAYALTLLLAAVAVAVRVAIA